MCWCIHERNAVNIYIIIIIIILHLLSKRGNTQHARLYRELKESVNCVQFHKMSIGVTIPNTKIHVVLNLNVQGITLKFLCLFSLDQHLKYVIICITFQQVNSRGQQSNKYQL